MAITLDRAVLISMVVESMLFGVFLVMFSFSVYVLVGRRGLPIINGLLVTAVLLVVVAIMHFSVDAYRLMAAFITHRDAPGGPVTYLNALANPTYLFKSIVYIIQTLLGDACMIYRCWIIWQKKHWIVALPCLLLLSCAASGVGVIVSFSRVGPTTQVYEFAGWVSSFFSLTLATNTISTILIVFRIWSVDRAAGKFRQTKSSLKPVISAVVESGLIYSISLVCLLAAYLPGTWAHFIILDALTPIIGIVFSMIIVRIGLSMSWGESSEASIRRNAPPLPSSYIMQTKVTTVHVSPRSDEEDGSDYGFSRPKSGAEEDKAQREAYTKDDVNLRMTTREAAKCHDPLIVICQISTLMNSISHQTDGVYIAKDAKPGMCGHNRQMIRAEFTTILTSLSESQVDV
ncbi:hypothetical protein FIBSPDRAFT_1039852 [Athelia psychrophila]|uniref:Uncharacterized protein n=1 Tax=Athelia psychrophila TaxID=1759441 RepID=A0A166R335_9AGAM|nr:hypothetical protein FIBSPDRAFT_1039852 [Fibularhizoctonia sp. CBS 109695]